MSTRAIAVKKTLRDWAVDQPVVETEKVQVTYGLPIREPERRWIAVGAVTWTGTEWVTNRSRQESFAVTVIFNVQMSGGIAEEAEVFSAAMADAFEDRLKADPSIGGLCVTSGFNAVRLSSWPIDGKYEAQYETEVTATCRP